VARLHGASEAIVVAVAYRRLLALERQTQHCTPAATTFEQLVLPSGDTVHQAPGLRFGDARVTAVLAALCDFRWMHNGFHCSRPAPARRPPPGSEPPRRSLILRAIAASPVRGRHEDVDRGLVRLSIDVG
jgi:hypothetical protein